tara:strand:- start:11191 stop:12285 length:1095 start_codon:yes stop_codon:yes gene_type:complete
MNNSDQQITYLYKSLKHHPSPFIICGLKGDIKWTNLACNFIFRLEDQKELAIKDIHSYKKDDLTQEDEIANSYNTSVEVNLRNINFFIRTRIHEIPGNGSKDFLLIEILCPSRAGLEALQKTIACIEFDRIELAYQKQIDLKTNKVTGIEALLRMKDENNEFISNDQIIPQIEGESLFSLVVMASILKLKDFLNARESLGLLDATVYLNVSAHTIMLPEFCNIFTELVDEMNLGPNEFGLEVTETAELGNTELAGNALKVLKEKGIKIALDDFGAGYSSLRYLKDLPVDVVKLDKVFTNGLEDPTTSKLISFVVEVCQALNLEMIGEGIETEDQKSQMLRIGCNIGQGYLMHRPEFLDSFKKQN